MQYVRSISGSVSKTWNSINPATLSGAIDVIVVEQEDGSLACSPFHVRFGKFSLLRPYEKKVEFRVHDEKQDYSMKLGEGGEAFFVFETSDNIPEALQTSPLVSPASSPPLPAEESTLAGLQEPDFLDLSTDGGRALLGRGDRPGMDVMYSSSAPKIATTLGKPRSVVMLYLANSFRGHDSFISITAQLQ
jgi:phosphatidate phosphatase LPIN